MFVNCYGDWAPLEGTIVDVRVIVTPMMDYDVMLHLVVIYIGLSCASLSIVQVFEAEQSYSGIIRQIINDGWSMCPCIENELNMANSKIVILD